MVLDKYLIVGSPDPKRARDFSKKEASWARVDAKRGYATFLYDPRTGMACVSQSHWRLKSGVYFRFRHHTSRMRTYVAENTQLHIALQS